MPSWPRSLIWSLVVLLALIAGGYVAVRYKRGGLVDLGPPRTAAARFVAHEPLYRPEDGHYQYKYLPASAVLMVPFTWVSKEVADFTWLALTMTMAVAFVRVSLATLPDRRRSAQALLWLTLLLTGKFLVKELALGQFNLPLALLLFGAVIAGQHGRAFSAGALVGAAVFVKPYALVFVPWLAWTLGWRPFIPFGLVLAGGLLLPAASYGWSGNLTLLHEWYRTVVETTEPNLLWLETISFASMWAKWLNPGPAATALALASAVSAVAAGLFVMSRRRHVAEPGYLEAAYFLLLVPLLSPQGWDYVLVLAIPAYMCIVDRWPELPRGWRAAVLIGFFFTSFTIFDLLRRPLYTLLMKAAVVTVGAILVAACLVRLRWQAAA